MNVEAYAWGRLYHKSLWTSGIRYPVGKLWEDLFTTYKLLYSTSKIAVIDTPLYYYFINDEGIVHSPWTLQKLDELEAYESQISFFLEQNDVEMAARLARAYVNCLHAQYLHALQSDCSESKISHCCSDQKKDAKSTP